MDEDEEFDDFVTRLNEERARLLKKPRSSSKVLYEYVYKPPRSTHHEPIHTVAESVVSSIVIDEAKSTGEKKSEDGTKKRYPTGWMLKDKEIKKLYEKKPLVFDILNFIHDYTRTYTDDQIKNMIAEANAFKKYTCDVFQKAYLDRGLTPSTFLVNDKFYTRMAKETGIPKRTCQRYVCAFARLNVIFKLGKSSNGSVLYNDGFYRNIKLGDRIVRRKEPFLREKSIARESLLRIMTTATHC